MPYPDRFVSARPVATGGSSREAVLGRCWLRTAWFRRRPPAAGLCANEISAEAEACLSPAVGAILKFHRRRQDLSSNASTHGSRAVFSGCGCSLHRALLRPGPETWQYAAGRHGIGVIQFRGWVRSSGLVLHERSTTRILTTLQPQAVVDALKIQGPLQCQYHHLQL